MDIEESDMEEFNNYPIVEQPLNLKVNLFRHQLHSINRMEAVEKSNRFILNEQGDYLKTNFAIQGDPTGYGKTLSMIGLILRDKMPWDMNTLYTSTNVSDVVGYGNSYIIRKRAYKRINTTFILVNQSLLPQWLDELKKTNLKVKTIMHKADLTPLRNNEFDVVLCLHTLYNDMVLLHRYSAWKRFIFDEPSMIKVTKMEYTIAGFYWFVSATYNNIPWNYRQMKGDFMKQFFPKERFFCDISDYVIKNKMKYIELSFKMPTTISVYHKCHNPLKKLLSGIASSSLVEMISAGDIEGAVKSLGGDTTSNIIDLIKNKKLRELRIINSNLEKIDREHEEERYQLWISKKERLEKVIQELDQRIEKYLESPCNICYDDLDQPVMLVCCQNIFCGLCILNWLKTKNTCPLCRAITDSGNIVKINKDKKVTITEKVELRTKQDEIVSIIKSKEDGKFIVFSDYESSFSLIRKAFQENDIAFKEIKGTVEKRRSNIEKFKSGEINVIFLNSKNNGSGINLQETTDIIIFHELNSNILTQVIGRANRIGRKESLIVHHLVDN